MKKVPKYIQKLEEQHSIMSKYVQDIMLIPENLRVGCFDCSDSYWIGVISGMTTVLTQQLMDANVYRGFEYIYFNGDVRTSVSIDDIKNETGNFKPYLVRFF